MTVVGNSVEVRSPEQKKFVKKARKVPVRVKLIESVVKVGGR